MRRMTQVCLNSVTLMLAALTLATAQAPGPGGGRGPGRGAPPNPQMMAQRMLEFRERILDRMPLSDGEKAAAKDALKAKADARARLVPAVNALREAIDGKASDDKIKERLKAFSSANATYYRAVEEADKKLLKKVSPRAGAELVLAGFIETGGIGFPRIPGGFPGPGGFRGGFPGGPGGPRGGPGRAPGGNSRAPGGTAPPGGT